MNRQELLDPWRRPVRGARREQHRIPNARTMPQWLNARSSKLTKKSATVAGSACRLVLRERSKSATARPVSSPRPTAMAWGPAWASARRARSVSSSAMRRRSVKSRCASVLPVWTRSVACRHRPFRMSGPGRTVPVPIVRDGSAPQRLRGNCRRRTSAELSALGNWPIQLRLVPPNAPYLRGADLLLVADCVPFAMADFHRRLLRGRPVVIGCPKLDDGRAYVEKLVSMLAASDVRSVTVVHMEVPCCTGLVRIVKAAVQQSGCNVPLKEVTVSIRGRFIGPEALTEQ